MFERLTAVIWWYHEELDGFEKPVYDNEADFLNDIASAVNHNYPRTDMAKTCIWVKDETMANIVIGILEPVYGNDRARIFQLTKDNYAQFI